MVKRPLFSDAQQSFIKSVRDRVDAEQVAFFRRNDWCRMSPDHGRNSSLVGDDASALLDSLCCKDVAVWVPHLLMPDHVPSCPRCRTSEHVDIATAQWMKQPKMLHGMRTHRCLDTMKYKCHAAHCGRWFCGCNEGSLEVDAKKVLGIINFRVSNGFAVDEDLYSYIAAHSSDATASIFNRMRLVTADKCLEDATFYFKAIQLKQVKKPNKKKQSLVDPFLTKNCELSDARKKRKKLSDELNRLTEELESKKRQHEADVELVDMFKRKSSRNHRGLPFRGLGEAKTLLLMQRHITTAKELLAYDGTDPAVKVSWKDVVQAYYDSINSRIRQLENKIKELTESDLWAEIDVLIQEEMAVDGSDAEEAVGTVTAPRKWKPPPFSKMTDPLGYNARCLPKSTINRLVAHDFVCRKAIMEDKMRGIKCNEIMKIDWHCKLAPKIKVYAGRGQSFAPFKSTISIQNEDALTVFWKCYPCAESFTAIEDDLKRLNQRFGLLKCAPKVVYVDNCCTTRGKLTAIFKGVLVKLDTFHWIERWDVLLFDKDSAEAAMFRGMLHQMLFVVEHSECQRARFFLVSKGNRNPTSQQILKEAKATIPGPDKLARRLSSLLRCVFFMDSCLDAEPPASRDNKQRFFKPMTDKLRRKLETQKSHVTNGCLSDPSFAATGVRIHRVNPKTGKARTGRSTGTNENDNMLVLRTLNSPTVGVARADRVISDHCEQSNEKKKVNRLGEEPAITHRTEKIYWVNSLATSVGFKEEELPYKVSIPTPISELKEHLGLTYNLPTIFQSENLLEGVEEEEGDDGAPGNAQRNIEELTDSARQDEMGEFLDGVDFDSDEEDIDVGADQFQDLVDDTDVLTNDVALERAILVHAAKISDNESTFATFKRLTEQRPWVPFKKPDAPPESFTDVDREECALFNRLILEHKFNREAGTLWCTTGHGAFSKVWDMEVANRFKDKIAGEGEDNIVLTHRKSYAQLQQHCDLCEKHKTFSNRGAPNNPHLDHFRETLRQTRREMQPTQEAMQCEPVAYRPGLPQFGNPTVLNQRTSAAAVVRGNPAHANAPFFLRPPTTDTVPNSRKVLGKGFRSKMCCWRCGFKRNQHDSGMCGNNCRGNVGREECSWCGWRLDQHDDPSLVGPRCARPPQSEETEKQWCPNSD